MFTADNNRLLRGLECRKTTRLIFEVIRSKLTLLECSIFCGCRICLYPDKKHLVILRCSDLRKSLSVCIDQSPSFVEDRRARLEELTELLSSNPLNNCVLIFAIGGLVK